MARSIRVPGVADIRKVDDRVTLRALGADPGLDRRFDDTGPAANRVLVGRVNEALRVDGKPLPSVAPRGDAERAQKPAGAAQAARPRRPLWDADTLAALVAAVRGERARTRSVPATQQAVGRLFNTAMSATPKASGRARSRRCGAHAQSDRVCSLLRATGKLRRSRRLLADRVNGDLAGVHGTGIADAQHGARLREDARVVARSGASGPRPTTPCKACLFAPETVLRQATAHASTVAGEVKPGTLVLLELDKISASTRDAETVFMAGTWAECPAMHFVPALYRAVWEGALRPRRRRNGHERRHLHARSSSAT